ncbi:MAG: translocation/assembly module TamB domain-containing protein, partial [Legionella sp.]
VHLKQIPQGPINATGELNVTKGDYKAYNQNLDIEQGELFFTGGAIDNPGINVRAIKKINASASSITGTNQLLDFNSSNLQNANLSGSITVGVEVTGRLAEPKIQLFSNPAILSQADILSMLVLGRPASQANKAGGQLLMTAISSMNLTGKSSGGTQLLSQLKKSTGLDFDVQTNSNYNLATNQMNDSTGFVVGKSLSERMYLSYTMGLSQSDPNVLTLKYLLNKFFSIQVSSSTTSNGIDFLYTSTKK